MNRQLLLLIAFSILILSCLIKFRHFLRTWFAHLRTKPSVAKRRSRNKSLPYLFPTKKPDCPLCQPEEILPSEVTPEPPPLVTHKRGRPRSIDTDLRFCPNPLCRYYGWLARGNICSNRHPNAGKWRQLKCIVRGTYFMETQGTVLCSVVSI